MGLREFSEEGEEFNAFPLKDAVDMVYGVNFDAGEFGQLASGGALLGEADPEV